MVLNNVKYCTHTPNALYIGEVLFLLLLLSSQLSLLIAKLIANYCVLLTMDKIKRMRINIEKKPKINGVFKVGMKSTT
jgi:hypothetical protein